MDPVSNADRLVMVLRQKLRERSKAATGARGEKPPKAQADAAVPVSAARVLAGVEGVDERAVRRAVIQDLLADQLGMELLNDAQFQQIISRVTDAIEDDAEGAALLSRVVSELRAA